MSSVVVRREGELWWVGLNRPDRRNAHDEAMVAEFDAVLVEARRTPSILLVHSTTPGMFAAGADIREMRDRGSDHALRAINAGLFERLEAHRWPTIALVDGPALGGGCEMALACDFRIASRRAVFAQPELSLGILANEGYRWFGDAFDDDVPYLAEVNGKRIAVIPKLNYANDWRAWSGGLGNASTYFEGFKTSFDFIYQEGVILVQAALTDNSWLLYPDIRLTGGFAFASWFGGPNRGQLMLTMGGYHPDFHRDGYPVVPGISAAIEPVAGVFRQHWPASAEIYLANGVPAPGSRFANPVLAATYQRILHEAEAAGADRSSAVTMVLRALR